VDQHFEYGAYIDSALIRYGTNVLAAELHQFSPTSSDAAFALQLVATGPESFLSFLFVGIEVEDGDVIIHHSSYCDEGIMYIQEATFMPGPHGMQTVWTTLPGGPHPSPYNVGPATGSRFFQVTDTP